MLWHPRLISVLFDLLYMITATTLCFVCTHTILLLVSVTDVAV